MEIAGEQAISAVTVGYAEISSPKTSGPATRRPAWPTPRRDPSVAGVEPASPWLRSIRNLHHQRSSSTGRAARRGKPHGSGWSFRGNRLSFVGREAFGGKRSNEARHHPERGAASGAANGKRSSCRGALSIVRRLANPELVRPAIGCRLSPRSLRAGPALEARAVARALRIRVSRSGVNRKCSERAQEHKKPSGAAAREGPSERIVGLTSDEIASKSRARALPRRTAVEACRDMFAACRHCATLVVVRDHSRTGGLLHRGDKGVNGLLHEQLAMSEIAIGCCFMDTGAVVTETATPRLEGAQAPSPRHLQRQPPPRHVAVFRDRLDDDAMRAHSEVGGQAGGPHVRRNLRLDP